VADDDVEDCSEEDDSVDEPLDPSQAKKLIGTILKEGTVSFTSHAEKEMAEDDLSTVDCVNVLRGGVVEQPELERGTWRYRVRTNRIVVVVSFRSKSALRVVTAWRIQ
jgi:hypothetical protein